MDCIFCGIIKENIPSKKVFEDEDMLAFYDISPCAPVHVILVPKQHIKSINEVDSNNSGIVAKLLIKIPQIAASLPLKKGYRVITNCGEDSGQTVPHLHFHIIGGEKLTAKLG